MAEARIQRTLESRDSEKRDNMVREYAPPSILPTPNPQPGWVFRWVATHVLGTAEHTNVSQKLREGWTPVKAVDHPELMLAGNAMSGNVEIGGLMLCKMPEELAQSRQRYYEKMAQSQMESVDNTYMRQNDPRMPLFADRKSAVSRSGMS